MSRFYRLCILFTSLFVLSNFQNTAKADSLNDGKQFNGGLNKMFKNGFEPLNNDSRKSNFILSIGAGTTGASITGAFYFNNLIGVRAEYAGIPNFALDKFGLKKIAVDSTNDFVWGAIEDNVSEFGLEKQNFALGIDKFNFSSWGFDVSLRPFRGIWRIDVGIRNVSMLATISANASVSKEQLEELSKSYDEDNIIESQSLDVSSLIKTDGIDISASATVFIAKGWKPYFGTGWDFNLGSGFTLSFDLGVLYLGEESFMIKDLQFRSNGGIKLNEEYIAMKKDELPDVAKDDFEQSINEIRESVNDANNKIDDLSSNINDLDSKINDLKNNSINIGSVPVVSNIIGDSISPSKFTRFYTVIKVSFGYRFNIG